MDDSSDAVDLQEAFLREIDLTERIAVLESLAFTAYCQGYSGGHNDTVEGMYTPPEDYPAEWAERRLELLDYLIPAPTEQPGSAWAGKLVVWMRDAEAMLTITRRNSNCGPDMISLTVNDGASGNRVVELLLTLDNFGKCITGLSNVDAEYQFCPTPEAAQNYKKERIFEIWYCDKVNSFIKKHQSAAVRRDFVAKNDGEWTLFSDGTGSQQPGEQHHYSVVRYQTVTGD